MVITGTPLVLNSGSSGSACQQAYLPPSSVFNSPKTWTKDTSMTFPEGYNIAECIQLVRGDNIYIIGNGKIKVGNLRTKVWEAGDVATNMGPPACACFYDDYKLFIIENVNSAGASVNIRTSVINIVDRTQVSGPTLSYNVVTVPNKSAWSRTAFNNVGPVFSAFFEPNARSIYFTYTSRAGAMSRDYDSFDRTYCGEFRITKYELYASYQVDTNTLEKHNETVTFVDGNGRWYINSDTAISEATSLMKSEANKAANRKNFRATMKYKNGIIYVTNGESMPTGITTWSISGKTVSENSGSSNLLYCPTAWMDFGQNIIAFNGNTPTLFSPADNTQSALVVPNAPETPPFASLNAWDNQIIFLTASGLYKLPYVAQEPATKIPVWYIAKGQQFCGMKELPITNKPTITTQWQTAQNDFEICLGEYDTAGEYRLLIKS